MKGMVCVQGHAWSELISVNKQSDPRSLSMGLSLYTHANTSVNSQLLQALADLLCFESAASH